MENIRHYSFVFKPQSLAPRELFIASSELVRPATTPFYAKLDQTLNSFGFAAQARSLCAPAYWETGRGRPGIDPVVYFKMLMVGNYSGQNASEEIEAQDFFSSYGTLQMGPDNLAVCWKPQSFKAEESPASRSPRYER